MIFIVINDIFSSLKQIIKHDLFTSECTCSCVQVSDQSQWSHRGRQKDCVLSMALQNSTLTWGDNFVNGHLCYTFEEFVQDFCKGYHKVLTNEQVYMNLLTIKQNLNK
jgi:hypothetical protein